METWEWIVLVALAAGVVLLAVAIFARARSRSRRLEGAFGPEYDRAVSNTGRRNAEKRLTEVEKQHEDLRIRALPGSARERYLEDWKHAETRFIADPHESAAGAERIIRRVLEERGYPTDGDAEDQVAHLAVDHPDVAERFRHGRAMLENVNGAQATEDLRKALIDFRIVLDELLEDRVAA
jgi:hypothetical protein